MSTKRIVVALAVVWLLLFVAAVVLARATEPSGSGFTRGLNRAGVFFQWKSVSSIAGILSAVVTRRADPPLGRGLRWVGYGPLVTDLTLLAALIATLVVAAWVG